MHDIMMKNVTISELQHACYFKISLVAQSWQLNYTLLLLILILISMIVLLLVLQ